MALPTRELSRLELKLIELTALQAEEETTPALEEAKSRHRQAVLAMSHAVRTLRCSEPLTPEQEAELAELQRVEEDDEGYLRQMSTDPNSALQPVARAMLRVRQAESAYWDALYGYHEIALPQVFITAERLGIRAGLMAAAEAQEAGEPLAWRQMLASCIDDPRTDALLIRTLQRHYAAIQAILQMQE